MEQSTVVQILDPLKERCAGDLESQTLEVKGWCRDEKDLAREISEAAVCLANGDGGLVLVGVDDKKLGDAAITRCPYPVLRPTGSKLEYVNLHAHRYRAL